MKEKTTKIFTSVIMTFYALTVLLMIILLSFESHRGNKIFDSNFTSLSTKCARFLSDHPAESDDFCSLLVNEIKDNPYIAALQITKENNLIFNYPEEGDKPEKNTFFVKVKGTEIREKDGEPVILTAGIYTLLPSILEKTVYSAFFIVLAASIACIIYLLIMNFNKNKEKENSELEEDFDLEEDSDFEENSELEENSDFEEDLEISEDPFEKEIMEAEESEKNNENYFEITEEASVNDDESQEDESENIETDYENENTSEYDEKDFSEDSDNKNPLLTDDEESFSEENTDEDDFSKIENLKSEEERNSILDKELVNASSLNQDLALLTVKIPDIKISSFLSEECSKKIFENSSDCQLVFKNGDDGFSEILENTDTDKAIKIAQNMYKNIQKILSEKGINACPVIGISCKSLRLISSKRLINESQKALEKAMEDKESPIVAFRVNLEKYRDYLTKKQ